MILNLIDKTRHGVMLTKFTAKSSKISLEKASKYVDALQSQLFTCSLNQVHSLPTLFIKHIRNSSCVSDCNLGRTWNRNVSQDIAVAILNLNDGSSIRSQRLTAS